MAALQSKCERPERGLHLHIMRGKGQTRTGKNKKTGPVARFMKQNCKSVRNANRVLFIDRSDREVSETGVPDAYTKKITDLTRKKGSGKQ